MKSDQWQVNTQIPQPKTWLNQSRWLDDPKDLKDWSKTFNKKNKNKPNNAYQDEIKRDYDS